MRRPANGTRRPFQRCPKDIEKVASSSGKPIQSAHHNNVATLEIFQQPLELAAVARAPTRQVENPMRADFRTDTRSIRGSAIASASAR